MDPRLKVIYLFKMGAEGFRPADPLWSNKLQSYGAVITQAYETAHPGTCPTTEFMARQVLKNLVDGV